MNCCGSSNKDKKKETKLAPLDQLKVRLGNGEINKDEFLETKKVIEQ
jgi:uncharacterized membrane protein